VADPRIRKLRDAVAVLQAGRFDVDTAVGEDEVGQLGLAIGELGRAFECRVRVSDALALVAQQVNTGLTLDEVCGSVYESLRSLIPYDRIGVSFLEDGGRVVRAHWARAEDGPIRLDRGYSARLQGSSLERIVATGEARILDDLEAYLAEHPTSESTRLLVEEGIRSSLTCPLTAMGMRVGFIFFSSRRKHAYRDEHRATFHHVAVQLSLAIEKSRLYESLLAANRELEHARSELEYRAAHDPLTAIWNRGAIVDLLSREVARSRRESRPLSVLLIDVDHFKVVNDAHGHAVGDVVLREVADRLEAGLRSAEVVGRYGGDEFMIVLYPCGARDAGIVAERLRRQVASRPVRTQAGPIAATISLGVAVADGQLARNQIVEAADEALYRAKQSGRNRFALAPGPGESPRPRRRPAASN